MAKVIKKSAAKPAKKAAAKKVTAKKASAAKKASKKSVAKKPAVKKVTAKKAATKKPVAKKAATKKEVAKKAVAKKLASKKDKKAVKQIKRVPPRIVRKPVAPTKSQNVGEVSPIDTAKAVAFAMSIAQEMKRSAAKEDAKRADDEIKLTRRPTTRKQGAQTESFPASDLREFKKRLLEARARATSGVNAMKATGFNESEDHEADGGDGTNQTLRLQALGQMGNINRTIQQIDEALHRIEDGTYGVCTSCGQLIRKPRLINQPFVLTCMECQSAMERETK